MKHDREKKEMRAAGSHRLGPSRRPAGQVEEAVGELSHGGARPAFPLPLCPGPEKVRPAKLDIHGWIYIYVCACGACVLERVYK